jgi:hypothetical protein
MMIGRREAECEEKSEHSIKKGGLVITEMQI